MIFITNERIEWKKQLKDFPASQYCNYLTSKGMRVLSYGTVKGSSRFDLYIKFQNGSRIYNFAMKDSTSSFVLAGADNYTANGIGYDDFVKLLSTIKSSYKLFSSVLVK